jgi:hypothetical protein
MEGGRRVALGADRFVAAFDDERPRNENASGERCGAACHVGEEGSSFGCTPSSPDVSSPCRGVGTISSG